MLETNLIKKERKQPKKPRAKTVKKVSVRASGNVSFFDSFNHVAPLSWVPPYYRSQIKAAKPVRVSKLRTKKKKIPLQ